MPAEYVIYRKISVAQAASLVYSNATAADQPQKAALLRVGDATGNNARQALVNWFVESGETEVGDFMVIPLSHHHALSPNIDPQPRLSFS